MALTLKCCQSVLDNVESVVVFFMTYRTRSYPPCPVFFTFPFSNYHYRMPRYLAPLAETAGRSHLTMTGDKFHTSHTAHIYA